MDFSSIPGYAKILQELEHAWEEVQTQQALCVVLLEGVSGSRKTGVIKQFVNSAQATCISGYGAKIPESYLPLRLAFESLVHLDVVQAELVKEPEQISSDWRIALTALAQIPPLLNLTSDPVWESLASWQPSAIARTIEGSFEPDEPSRPITLPGLFTLVLGEIAHLVPLVILLENLDQADAATLEALTLEILPSLRSTRALLIATFEPETTQRTNEFSGFIQAALGVSQSRQLCAEPLTVADIEMALHDTLPHLSPLRVTDLTEQVYSGTGGILARVNDLVSWLKTLPTEELKKPFNVPHHATWVQDRFASLPEVVQRLLSMAAVQGMYFCLEAVTEESGQSVGLILQDVSRSGFGYASLDTTIEVKGKMLHWYQFYGQYVRNLVYTSIPEEIRPTLHRQVALTLERLYGEESDAIAGLLAQQFEHGDMPHKAAFYFAKIARRANAQGAFDQALEYAQLGLDVSTTDLSEELLVHELSLQKARALMNSDKGYLAEDIFYQTLEKARQVHDVVLEMETLHYLGEMLLDRNVWDAGLELLESALTLAVEQKRWHLVIDGMEKLRDRYSKRASQPFLILSDKMLSIIQEDDSIEAQITYVEILEDKAWLYLQIREHNGAIKNASLALEKLANLENSERYPEIYYKVYRTQAEVFRVLDKTDEALNVAEQAIAWAGASFRRVNIARAHQTKAEILQQKGQIESGEREFRVALNLLLNSSDRATLAEIEGLYGLFLSSLGRKREARKLYLESYQHWHDLGDFHRLQMSLNNIAAIDKHLGDFESALTIYQQLLNEGITQNDISRQTLALNHLSDIYWVLDCLSEAESASQQSIQLCDIINRMNRKALAFRRLGRIYLSCWRLNEAWDALNEAKELCSVYLTKQINSCLINNIYVGRCLCAKKELYQASDVLSAVTMELIKLQDFIWIGIANMNMALTKLAMGQVSQARVLCEQTLDLFRDETWHTVEVHHLMARCYLAEGDLERAQSEIALAKSGFATLGLSHRIFQVENTELYIQEAQETGDWGKWRLLTQEELRYDFNHLGL